MLGLLTKATCPIGIDLDYDSLKIGQLAVNGEDVTVVNCTWVPRPVYVPPHSPQWQRWAVDALREACAKGQFRGKEIVVALPATDIFVELLRHPKASEGKPEDAVFAKIKAKMPPGWTRNNTVLRCIPTEQDNVLVIAASRAVIDRHLAIYERARVRVKSIAVWPMAMANCHARLFARRGTDLNSVVMLLDIQPDCSNVVVCRGATLLLARSIPIGVRQLGAKTEVGRLAWELTACRKQLLSLYRDVAIERLIFLSGPGVDPGVCRTIGAELGVRAQLGDCRVALGMEATPDVRVDDDEVQTSWALAFGLSLC